MNKNLDNVVFRGVRQSADGVIRKVIEEKNNALRFEAAFAADDDFIEMYRQAPRHFIFSERSRIARLGVQIKAESPETGNISENRILLTLTAASVIPGYPHFSVFKDFFCDGFPIGRIVFCDPDAMLSSEQVLAAIDRSELKLPASTTISSNGSILIAPHKVMCYLKNPLDKDTLERILIWENGREVLNRYQSAVSVPALTLSPGQGVITTCSMYLNDHYVVLQSGYELGKQLPATILDPIKTRGLKIYLEIVNESSQPIVNPLISAKIYKATPKSSHVNRQVSNRGNRIYTYGRMRSLEKKFDELEPSNCHFINKPAAMIADTEDGMAHPRLFLNGPAQPCHVSEAGCSYARHDFSHRSPCPHMYSTRRVYDTPEKEPASIVLKFFPNLIEHRDIINMAAEGRIHSLYFFEPSCEHGPFLSQSDHARLQEYHEFGIDVHWVSGLNGKLMTHTMRDAMGYFVVPDRLVDFHRAMLFAFYGSTRELSETGVGRFRDLVDALIDFWGKNIGILTGGGSGVMAIANTFAKQRGILSGANFLDITDQDMTTDVDFCQVFQSTCRHSRQKWFEVASFPIFNIGGIGTLEELGITLCNIKLSVSEPVPVILFDTEGDGGYWEPLTRQIHVMVQQQRAPVWIKDKLIITHDPRKVIDAYRRHLQLF